MFAGFILALRKGSVPVSLTEYLTLLGALQAGVVTLDVEDLYVLARSSLIKDERHIDRFDRVFAQHFEGLSAISGDIAAKIPEEWLRKLAERVLSPEEMAAIRALGGWEKL